MSREASRIMRRVFREIASTRFIVASLAVQLLLDASIEVVPAPDALDHLVIEADFEVTDLRDLRRVHDRFVRTVEEALAIDGHLQSHAVLEAVVAACDAVEGPLRLVRVDLRQEAEGPGIDPEDLGVGELQRSKDGPIASDGEHHIRLHVRQRHAFPVEGSGQVRFQEDFMFGLEPRQQSLRAFHRARDVRVGGDAELHGSTSKVRRSPTATKSVRAVDVRAMSSSFFFRSSTSPPASLTTRTAPAMSTTRSFAFTIEECM